MCYLSLSKALDINGDSAKTKIDLLQAELEAIPNTFYAAFWLYTHDFLYISQSIEQVTGHPFTIFQKHGMVFFQSIIPPHLIEPIYKAMNDQAALIANHPDFLFADEFLHVKAAVYDASKQALPVNYNAVLLDQKAFDPISYLVFCSWIDTRNKTTSEIAELESFIRMKLLDLKTYFFAGKPERYQLLTSKSKISEREKEVAKLLSKGHSSKSIGEKLNISFYTVESHRKNLLEKLNVKNTAELIYKISKFSIE